MSANIVAIVGGTLIGGTGTEPVPDTTLIVRGAHVCIVGSRIGVSGIPYTFCSGAGWKSSMDRYESLLASEFGNLDTPDCELETAAFARCTRQ